MSESAQTGEERRIFERFSARFPAKFKDTKEDYWKEVFLQNASAQGMCIRSRERYFLNDQIALDVALPDGGDPMVLNGSVVWVKLENLSMWDLGVQFPQIEFLKLQRLFKLTEEINL